MCERLSINSEKTIRMQGFFNEEQGLEFLTNPVIFQESQTHKPGLLRICSKYSLARMKNKNPIDEIKDFILKNEGLPKDTKNWEEIVVNFLNIHGENLICPNTSNISIYPREHFYKRAVSSWELAISEDLLLDDEYPVELNMIEMRNGKPETFILKSKN